MASTADLPPPEPPQTTTLLRDIFLLATLNESLGDIRNAAIYIRSNIIEWVGATSALPAKYLAADEVISLKGRVVIPGMVNTHHHMVQCLTRCIATDSQLFGWLTTLYPAWAHLTGLDVYRACRLAMAELLMTGCTCTSDHLYIYPNDVKLDHAIAAARYMGIRFHPTRGMMTKGRSQGGLCPDEVTEAPAAALAEARRLIEAYHDAGPFSMLRMGVAPCSPFTVDDDVMIAAAKLARSYPGVRLHTHLAENEEDIVYHEKELGCRPHGYIKRVGWDRDDVWFAHCVMLDGPEMDLFAARGIGIAHCPSSNMRLASGILPFRQLTQRGVNVGLGVDGTASNDSGNMLAEARAALLLARAKGDPSGMTVREALHASIKGGARNLGRSDIGEIAPGFAADLVAWRVEGTVACAGALHDPVAALLLCTPGCVDLNMVNGRVLIQDGSFKQVDIQEVIDAACESSAKIVAHANGGIPSPT